MRRSTTLTGLVGLGALAVVVASPTAQQNTAQIERVKDNLYLINGGRAAPGNESTTAAFVTTNGVVIVDTNVPGWGQAILDQIRSVTDKPVTMIINTHTHGDHVGSNAEFPASVEVVAHENTKTSMAGMRMFQGESARYLPGRTFSDRMSLFEGEDQIDLYYFGRAHTNGDTVVAFPFLRPHTQVICMPVTAHRSSPVAAAASTTRRRCNERWRASPRSTRSCPATAT